MFDLEETNTDFDGPMMALADVSVHGHTVYCTNMCVCVCACSTSHIHVHRI